MINPRNFKARKVLDVPVFHPFTIDILDEQFTLPRHTTM